MKSGGAPGRHASKAAGRPAILFPSILFFVSLPFGIAAFAFSRPVAGLPTLILASALVYVPLLMLVTFVPGPSGGRVRAVGAMAVLGTLGSASLGSGVAILCNFWFDAGIREQTVSVTGHRTHTYHGSTTYYLTLAPFGPVTEPLEVQVDREPYERYVRGPPQAPILVHLGGGALGMPHLLQSWGTLEVRYP